MKRTVLARRKLLRAKTRLRPVNSKRRAKLRAKQFGERAGWICSQLPCVVRGCVNRTHAPHHVKTRATGGTKRDCVPVCFPHHLEIHTRGRVTFERRYNLNLTELAVHYCGLYEHSFPQLAGRSEPDARAAPPSNRPPPPAVGTGSSAAGILS